MKKKIIVVVLSLVLVLTLAACGGKVDEPTDGKKVEETGAGNKVDETSETKKSDETAEAKKAVDTYFKGVVENDPDIIASVADKTTLTELEESQKQLDEINKQNPAAGNDGTGDEEKQNIVQKLYEKLEYSYVSGEVEDGAETAELVYNVKTPSFSEYVSKVVELSMSGQEFTEDAVDLDKISVLDKEIKLNLVKEDGKWKITNVPETSMAIMGLDELANPAGIEETDLPQEEGVPGIKFGD